MNECGKVDCGGPAFVLLAFCRDSMGVQCKCKVAVLLKYITFIQR